MSRNDEEYNPKWDMGVTPDGWPRAIAAVAGHGKRHQLCPSCGGSHPEGETPRKCLEAIGRKLRAANNMEDDE